MSKSNEWDALLDALNADDERPFATPVPYFSSPRRRSPTPVSLNSDDDAPFIAPRPYFVSNAEANLDDLRVRVLQLMARVNRAAPGSIERMTAQRELVSARANLRTAGRSRASELEAQLSALRQPGADERVRSRLEAELASVTALLDAIDGDGGDTTASKATNADDRWTNASGETVLMIDGAPRIVK